jgi:hypothetical protein
MRTGQTTISITAVQVLMITTAMLAFLPGLVQIERAAA